MAGKLVTSRLKAMQVNVQASCQLKLTSCQQYVEQGTTSSARDFSYFHITLSSEWTNHRAGSQLKIILCIQRLPRIHICILVALLFPVNYYFITVLGQAWHVCICITIVHTTQSIGQQSPVLTITMTFISHINTVMEYSVYRSGVLQGIY